MKSKVFPAIVATGIALYCVFLVLGLGRSGVQTPLDHAALSTPKSRTNASSEEPAHPVLPDARTGTAMAVAPTGLKQDEAATNAATLDTLLPILSTAEVGSEARTKRFNAAKQLRALGAEAANGLSLYRTLLRSDTEDSRMAGAQALAYTSESSPDSYNELLGALRDANPQVRVAGLAGLGILFNGDFANINAEIAVPALEESLKDGNRTVRADATSTLAQYIEFDVRNGGNGRPEIFVPVLSEELKDENPFIRINAIYALQQYGADASGALPLLRELAGAEDPNLRSAAQSAILRIQNDEVPIK